MNHLDRDTVLCISLSGRPGNTGTRFHNFLYDALGLNYVYKAFSTTDLEGAIRGIRALGIRGCGVSMPWKEACIPFLDVLEDSARAIGSVNTIVNDRGVLRAWNTDYQAVRDLVEAHGVDKSCPVVVRGSGGMAKACAAALRNLDYRHGTIVARNVDKGQALADECGWDWRTDCRGLGLDWGQDAILVNATPIGMEGGPEVRDLAFEPEAVRSASLVVEVVAMPLVTPLAALADSLGKPSVRGSDIMTTQALEQFVLYTGQRPDPEQVAAAAAWARR